MIECRGPSRPSLAVETSTEALVDGGPLRGQEPRSGPPHADASGLQEGGEAQTDAF